MFRHRFEILRCQTRRGKDIAEKPCGQTPRKMKKRGDTVHYINEKTFPRKEPKAAIRKDVCDGCAICVDVCPRQCLTVVVYPVRPNARIVRLTPEPCSGCGACQGTCPKEAIYIPGLSTADLRGYVNQALELSGICL